MDLKDIDINTRNWVDSAQDRYYWRALVNGVSYEVLQYESSSVVLQYNFLPPQIYIIIYDNATYTFEERSSVKRIKINEDIFIVLFFITTMFLERMKS